MKKHEIRLYCGDIITNSEEQILPTINNVFNDIKNEIKYFELKPTKNYEILQNSLTSLTLKIHNCPIDKIRNYMFRPFFVSLCCKDVCNSCYSKGQICFLNNNFQFKFLLQNESNLNYTVESNEIKFGYAITMETFIDKSRKSINKMNKIHARDITKELNLNECYEDPTFESIGTDGIETADLNASDSNYKNIELYGQGTSVESFLQSNPCRICEAENRNYFCTYTGGCEAQLFKIQISATNMPNNKVQPDVDISHNGKCFYASSNENCLLIDCQTNLNDDTKRYWPKCKLKSNEFYTSKQLNNNTYKILLPHHLSQNKNKLLEGIKSILIENNILQILVCCSCVLNISTTQEADHKSVFYFSNNSTHCNQNKCRLINLKRHTNQINNLIAQDRSVEKCEILTSDPRLISQYNDIIDKNGPLFSKDAFDIGCHSNPVTNEPYIYHYKLIPGATPFVARFIPISMKKEPAAREIIDQLINNNIIERNVSNWVSCAVWVPKTRAALTQKQAEEMNIKYVPLSEDKTAQQSLRLAINFKPLNSQLEMPVFPLPGVKTLFARLRPGIVLTVADLTQSYFSLMISKESSLLTGFFSGLTSDGVLTFKRAAQGVKSSGTMLLAALHNILYEVRDNIIQYSDNLIIFSSAADHVNLVDKVFRLLRESKMKIKKSKTLLNCTQPVKLLGMVYCPQTHRLFPDKTKIEGLVNMKIPNNITELKSFLGGVQYLLHCLNNIQDEIAILYAATRKSERFNFGTKEIEAFNTVLKQLAHPSNTCYFINHELHVDVRVDTSTESIGVLVTQDLPHPEQRTVSCGFYTKVLSATQRRYGPSAREALGIAVALKILEPSIQGLDVTVHTDCSSLPLLYKHADYNSKIFRYLSQIDNFYPPLKFAWVSSKDKKFRLADTLSRPYETNTINKQITPESEKDIKIRSSKLATTTGYKQNELYILMDYILKKDETELNEFQTGSIFIDQNLNVCELTNKGHRILLKHNTKKLSQSTDIVPDYKEQMDKSMENIPSVQSSNTNALATDTIVPKDKSMENIPSVQSSNTNALATDTIVPSHEGKSLNKLPQISISATNKPADKTSVNVINKLSCTPSISAEIQPTSINMGTQTMADHVDHMKSNQNALDASKAEESDIPLINQRLDNKNLSYKQNVQKLDFIDLVRTDNDGIFHYPDNIDTKFSNESNISRMAEDTDLINLTPVADIAGHNTKSQFFEDDNFEPPHSLLHISKIKNATNFASVEKTDKLVSVSKRHINEEEQKNLDLTDIRDRFILYLITKFEYLNIKQLSKLQNQEPTLEKFITQCKNSPNKTYKKADKKQTCFHYRQGLLIKSHINEAEIIRYQMALPKVAVIDLLIILHRKHSHLGRDKLEAKFSEHYFCSNLTEYTDMVIKNCYNCQLNLQIPRRRTGNYTHKEKFTLTGPGVLFYADCLKVVNHPNAQYDHLLILVDGFSNFCIAQAYKSPMTNELFLQIFMDRCLAYYPSVRYVITDNAKDLSGTKVQQSLNLLGIKKATISPHSHKSNYSELLIRYLTYSIRINTQEKCIPPTEWHRLLPLALIALNNTNYSRLNYSISPQIINTGIRTDFSSIFATLDDNYLFREGFSSYAIALNKSQFVNFYLLTQLKKEQDLKNQQTQSPKDINSIEPGCLVYKIDKALNLQGFSKKLRPRFNKLYLVLCVSSTAAYIRIYRQEIDTKKDLLTFEQFLNNPKNTKNKVLPNFTVEKVDLSEIKKVKNLVPLTRESKLFNDNFIVDFPEAREYMTYNDQDVPNEIFLNVEPDFADQIPRESNNEIFKQEQVDEEKSEIKDFIKKPCLRQVNKKVSFNHKVTNICENGIQTKNTLSDKYTLKRNFHLLPGEQNLLMMHH